METCFDKKSYMAYIKRYMRILKGNIEAATKGGDANRVAEFQAGAQTFVKKVLAEFDEYQFFLSESSNDEGIVVLCKWDHEDATFYFWKDGLKPEKV